MGWGLHGSASEVGLPGTNPFPRSQPTAWAGLCLLPATAAPKAPAGVSRLLSCALGTQGGLVEPHPCPEWPRCVPAGILIHPIPSVPTSACCCLQDGTAGRSLGSVEVCRGCVRGQSCHTDQSPSLSCWFIVTLSVLGASDTPIPTALVSEY